MRIFRSAIAARRLAFLGLMIVAIISGCGSNEEAEVQAPENTPATQKSKVNRRIYESPNWIDVYNPELSAPGYTLVLYRRRLPMLIDMDGKVVHTWPNVRVVGRARLLPTGHLAVISESGSLEVYDWDGQLTWSFALPGEDTFLHHDFIKLANGNYLALAHEPARESDFLLEVDPSGEVVWSWHSADHIDQDFVRAGSSNNKTHINSVHEIPPNRWFDDGREEFRPGNILISARNLNTIYIINRPGGEITWRLEDGLDYQHEAIMIPPGIQGAGNILLFNNGYHNLNEYRQSAVIELSPVDRSVTWEFRRRGFFSSTGGTQQSLPNGNLLVTSSQGGRVFELTRDGRIVWQWSPPYMPMRVSRYPADYSPQLEDLGPPSEEPIDHRDPARFIDENLFTFSLPHETRRVDVAGKSKTILKNPNRCQMLVLPESADLILGFGAWIDSQATPFVTDEGDLVQFIATLRVDEETEAETIFHHTVDKSKLSPQEPQDQVVLQHQRISLDSLGFQEVELCLSLVGISGAPVPGAFVWEEPLIKSKSRRAPMEADAEIDPEALAKQEKHLKAIGYIN